MRFCVSTWIQRDDTLKPEYLVYVSCICSDLVTCTLETHMRYIYFEKIVIQTLFLVAKIFSSWILKWKIGDHMFWRLDKRDLIAFRVKVEEKKMKEEKKPFKLPQISDKTFIKKCFVAVTWSTEQNVMVNKFKESCVTTLYITLTIFGV